VYVEKDERSIEVMGKFLYLFVAIFAVRDILKLISQVFMMALFML